MKKTRFILTAFIVIAIGFVAQSQTNYELYSIENIEIYCPSPDNKSLYTIENVKHIPTMLKRDLVSGEILKTYKVKLPTGDIGAIAVSNDDKSIYFVTNKEAEEGKLPFSDAIFSISLKNEALNKLYTFSENINFLTQLKVIENSLLINPYKGVSYIFNISKQTLKPVLENENYRMVFASAEKNGAVFIEIGESELFDLYFCDFSKKMKLTLIGKFQPDLRISTEEDENKVPYFIIDNNDFDWVSESYNKNRYPSMVMMLADNKLVMDSYPKLNDYEYISMLSLIDDTYLIGDRPSKKSISVFNIKNPKLTKTPTVSEDDLVGIKAMLSSEISFEKQKVQSDVLPQIFDAQFYTIVFTEQETSESNRSQEFIAYDANGTYAELKEKEDLIFLIKEDFVINEANALLFQDALDVLYPLDYFDKKAKANYKKDNKWIFVRSDSFGEKKGFVLFLNGSGKIIGLRADTEIE